jgi:uncharacterized protein (TIGR02246 family)
MKAVLVIALLTTATAVVLAISQSDAQRDVLKLTAEYEDAIRRRDPSVHERLFAEDYTYTPGNGNFMNRKGHMAFTASGAASVEWLRSEDQRVRVYGDTAVVTGRWFTRGIRDGAAPLERRIRYLLVYVKREGRWQIVAEQRTGVGADVVK